jgi:hypothetical protein
LFIEYFEGCQGIIEDLAPDERHGFQVLYEKCQEVEQAAAEMGVLRPVNVCYVMTMMSIVRCVLASVSGAVPCP